MTGRPGRACGIVLGAWLAASGLVAPAMAERGAALPERLHGQAPEAGWARVIVQLRVATLPEGQLDGGDVVTSQRQEIASIQSAVLNELAGADYRVIRTYETIPFLALEVSSDALQVLQRSALVVGMEEDRLDAPQDKMGERRSGKGSIGDHPDCEGGGRRR